MGSLFRGKPKTPPGPPPEGLEHLRVFPLVCQMGDDGNKLLESGLPGRAQREYLKVLWYLGKSGLVDQFLLGKAYLGLMAVTLQMPGNQLKALVNGPRESFNGPLEVVGALFNPAHHCFKERLLTHSDHQLYHDLCAYARGTLPKAPTVKLSRWDVSLASVERFPVLYVPRSIVACVIERAAPPTLAPDLKGQEMDIQVPGL